MSTKIYNAFRIKRRVDVWALLWRVRDQGINNVRLALREHYLDLVRRMRTDDPSYLEQRSRFPHDVAEHVLRLTLAHEQVRAAYAKDLGSPYRDNYTLDVSVALYPFKGRYYLRPFCESCSVVRGALDFVADLPELEDYHYQNQTDRPKHIGAREWSQRRKTWNGIFGRVNGLPNVLVIDVLDWSSWVLVDPWRELMHEWKTSPPALPSREEIWAEDLRALPSLRDDIITCEPGRIRGSTFEIAKLGENWTYRLGSRAPRRARSLDHAADRVWFEFQPPSLKRMARELASDARKARRSRRGKP